MRSGVLGGGQLAQGFRYIAGDFVGVDLQRLDLAFGVDDEGATQGQAFFFNARQRRRSAWVGSPTRGTALPTAGEVSCHTLCEKWVSVVTMYTSAPALELGIVFGCVFDFGGAVEGECSGHEDQHGPLAFERGVGHFDEFALAIAVDESGSLEGLDLVLIRDMVVSSWLSSTVNGGSLGVPIRVCVLIDPINQIGKSYGAVATHSDHHTPPTTNGMAMAGSAFRR